MAGLRASICPDSGHRSTTVPMSAASDDSDHLMGLSTAVAGGRPTLGQCHGGMPTPRRLTFPSTPPCVCR